MHACAIASHRPVQTFPCSDKTLSSVSKFEMRKARKQIIYLNPNPPRCVTTHGKRVEIVLLAYFCLMCVFSPWNLSRHHFHSGNYISLTYSESEFSVPQERLVENATRGNVCPVIKRYDHIAWQNLWESAGINYWFWTPVVENELSFSENNNMADYSTIDHLRQEIFLQYGYTSFWKPSTCNFVHDVSIIVPYKARLGQLWKFLVYMHPFLQLQQMAYRIIIVEQVDNLPFNRGKLFNVGFNESMTRFPSHCYIFHDVDILPMNLENLYLCTKLPRHMSAAINSFRYLLSYDQQFGGATSLTREQFVSVNGFPNAYFGWGGEDDNISGRLQSKNISTVRFDQLVSSYRMLPHVKSSPSTNLTIVHRGSFRRYDSDGLNNLKYTLTSIKEGPVFTHIQAEL